MKPYSVSCEKNQGPILEVLRDVFAGRKRVLEIASGTGQHAVHFGRALPHLVWQTSELQPNLAGVRAWVDEARLANVLPPLLLDVNDSDWSVENIDAVFNANTVHIVAWPEVQRMFAGIARVLGADGILCLYGPYNYAGKFTSDSNARFDQWLKAHNEHSGVRDFEAINQLAEAHGLQLLRDVAMPSNNRTLVWQRML
ncbi:MAG: DUF938 domain-containing protein [Pseudomonadota bacterium]